MPTGNVHYVLDGGALLHRIPWAWGLTYTEILLLYVQHVTQRYGHVPLGTCTFGYPPTSAAAVYHCLRVYHQAQQWRDVALPPQDWGWKLADGRLTRKS